MTKKDYIVIAEAFASVPVDLEDEVVTKKLLVTAVGLALLAENPRFDHYRFARACMTGLVTP